MTTTDYIVLNVDRSHEFGDQSTKSTHPYGVLTLLTPNATQNAVSGLGNIRNNLLKHTKTYIW